jgi:hypothetical protein
MPLKFGASKSKRKWESTNPSRANPIPGTIMPLPNPYRSRLFNPAIEQAP